MRAIMVMYDSLNLKMLESYGCDWTKTPNFKRLAQKSVQFEQCYVGSLPCMPARRELHTGRLNMFHRSWGPLEPFDDSMPEILRNNGIYTHLVSDHGHYWEDGGATYHNRYSSWEITRGQEGDKWKGDLSYKYDKKSAFEYKKYMLQSPEFKAKFEHDVVNRRYMDTEEKTSQAVTFRHGLEFIERNYAEDNWFLQIETFDPHEPFFTLPHDRELYPYHFTGDADIESDWPPYSPVAEDEKTIEHVRYDYAALVSKCDRYLGKVLDVMDQYNMWEDTMLIVNTDHGYLLGEHGWWAKNIMPTYNEVANIPLYIYDPRRKDKVGVKRNALVQTIDLAPTLLEYFGVEIPKDMQGKPLAAVINNDTSIREYAVFGYHGSQINVTDGRYVYMKAAENPDIPVYEYTLMPSHMSKMFQPGELQNTEMSAPFDFTKGCPVMKIMKEDNICDTSKYGNMLFDLERDILQNEVITDEEIEMRMKSYLKDCMKNNDAPEELYSRLGL